MQPRPEYKSDKCEVSSRYFVVGDQMASRWHILTGLPSLETQCQIVLSGGSQMIHFP